MQHYQDYLRHVVTATPVIQHTDYSSAEKRPAEVCLVEAGQYGQWSLWKSTVFKNMYTAKHPIHADVWIDATRDGAALASFRALVRSKGGRT